MDGGFWRGRRVLLTGHTGFKGSWLALWLQRLGADVTGFALAPLEPSLFAQAQAGRGMRDLRGDVRDLDAVRAAFDASRPEVVIHLAAQSLVRRSYDDPCGTFAVNVMGTAHLLEAARNSPDVRAIVVVTSDKCYANEGGGSPHLEGDPLGGRDPYSASKACAELVTASYRRSYFTGDVPVASARAGNVIGGGDWAQDRLVPDAIRAFVARRPLEVRNASATRPWQHVLEPLHAYLLLGQKLCESGEGFAEAWNVGPEGSDAVSSVATRLAALWGDGARWQEAPGKHPAEAAALVLDSSKARRRLGWAPRLALEEALSWSVEWYRACHEGADLRRLTEEQIERFSARHA